MLTVLIRKATHFLTFLAATGCWGINGLPGMKSRHLAPAPSPEPHTKVLEAGAAVARSCRTLRCDAKAVGTEPLRENPRSLPEVPPGAGLRVPLLTLLTHPLPSGAGAGSATAALTPVTSGDTPSRTQNPQLCFRALQGSGCWAYAEMATGGVLSVTGRWTLLRTPVREGQAGRVT